MITCKNRFRFAAHTIVADNPVFYRLPGIDSLWSIGRRANGPAARGQAGVPARQD